MADPHSEGLSEAERFKGKYFDTLIYTIKLVYCYYSNCTLSN